MMQQITVGRPLTRRSYNTGLWTDGIGPAPPYLARGFAYGARFYRYRGAKPFDERERLRSHIGCFPEVNVEEWSENSDHCWQSAIELVIFASSHDRAKSAATLLFGAMLLLDGQSLVHERVIPLPDDREELDALPRFDRHREINFSYQSGLCEATALAAKLSYRKKWRYAAAKYWISHRICSVPWTDTHPTQGKRFGVELDPSNHVLFAQAIIAAYSVIEELEFEVRTTKENPHSRIKGGQWDPVVREELENRLRSGGIDLTDDEVFIQRGTPTIVERAGSRRGVVWGTKASWAAGEVRDRYLSVVDAIDYAGWLRSNVSSHKLSRRVRRAASLTIYDVQNVQMLARRLLLETTGFLPTRATSRTRQSALDWASPKMEVSELW